MTPQGPQGHKGAYNTINMTEVQVLKDTEAGSSYRQITNIPNSNGTQTTHTPSVQTQTSYTILYAGIRVTYSVAAIPIHTQP